MGSACCLCRNPTDSARVAGLLFKPHSEVSACGLRLVGYAANSAANPPYILVVVRDDDGETTAPSKWIIDVLPAYEGRKASAGPDIVEFIGMPALRPQCAHFNAWLITLEKLPWVAGAPPGQVCSLSL